MNPFDLKAALLAKHGQHPVIIHFPIALFIISVAFDLLGIWRSNPIMLRAAYYNLVGAALTAPVAIATGLTAWQWQLEGAKLKGNLLLHMVFALSASGMIWMLCAWRFHQRKRPQGTPGFIYISLALATVLLIAIAGHLGGMVSGVESGVT
jgi:Predicted membrane protein